MPGHARQSFDLQHAQRRAHIPLSDRRATDPERGGHRGVASYSRNRLTKREFRAWLLQLGVHAPIVSPCFDSTQYHLTRAM